MQVLWKEVFSGNLPFTVDEFLYCYKPSEISQSLGFSCRLDKSLPSSNRRWEREFSFVSGFWAENPTEVGRDPFPPYTGEMDHLCLEGVSFFTTHLTSFVIYLTSFFFL